MLTIRGQFIQVHDRELAHDFLSALTDAHIEALRSKSLPPQMTIQSSPGEGWRSLAAEKRLKKNNRAAELPGAVQPDGKSQAPMLGVAAVDLTPAAALDVDKESPAGQGWRSKVVEKKVLKAASAAANFDIEAEIQARMAALEHQVRAQVLAQVVDGEVHHSARGLIDASPHLAATAAKHNFKNHKPFAEGTARDLRCQARARYSVVGEAETEKAASNDVSDKAI